MFKILIIINFTWREKMNKDEEDKLKKHLMMH